ncbi:MAG: anaerobic ribonucleoside-triphosphate reductase activating protein [Bacilli bacterium]|nr:anaerobic ribonucleoside-triphosphate reductase activating protein [Bacilli bacterium]
MKDLICGFEKMSMVDYDGKIAATMFLGNCNFRCPFCHNASLVLNYQNIEKYTLEEILSYLKKRSGIIEAVCITGGEPTIYPDLEFIMREFKNLNLLVKLDTNGSNPKVIKDLVGKGLVDYIAMDIKNSLSKYPQTTSIINLDIDKIKESIDFIMKSGIDYEFRTTLVKEYHNLDDIKEISQIIKGAKKYILQCFVDNGECLKQGLHKIDKEDVLGFKVILDKTIENVLLRNYE